jgi:hypothetical protein
MRADAIYPDAIAYRIGSLWLMQQAAIASVIRGLLHQNWASAIVYCIDIMLMQYIYCNG